MMKFWIMAGATLALAACGGEQADPAADPAPVVNAAEAGAGGNQAAAAAASGAGGMPACPFRKLRNLAASVEGGRVLVTGNVDFLMGGFEPELSPREDSAPPVLRLDLEMTPEPGAFVNDELRYQAPVGGGYRRLEIVCGGKVLETLDMTVI